MKLNEKFTVKLLTLPPTSVLHHLRYRLASATYIVVQGRIIHEAGEAEASGSGSQ